METTLLHIFRNTPLGREYLLQSAYFCKTVKTVPVIYLPKTIKFLMYFENDVIQIDLDKSYLSSPETARSNAVEIVTSAGLPEPRFIEPKHFTASTLPDIPVDFDFMCVPRTITDLSSKIGLGYIGPRVRRIVQAAKFPILIPSCVFKKWNSIMVFYGGSANAIHALRLGLRLNRLSGLPLDLFTQTGKYSMKDHRMRIKEEHLEAEVEKQVRDWRIYREGDLGKNLYCVPHDALVVVGTYRHGIVQQLLFGSTMEKIQSVLPNNLLIVGSNYQAPM